MMFVFLLPLMLVNKDYHSVISSSSGLLRRPHTSARKVHSRDEGSNQLSHAIVARQVLLVSRTGRASTCWSPQPCNAMQSSWKRTLSIFSWCYISNLPVAAGNGSSEDSTGASPTIKQQLFEQTNRQLRTTQTVRRLKYCRLDRTQNTRPTKIIKNLTQGKEDFFLN